MPNKFPPSLTDAIALASREGAAYAILTTDRSAVDACKVAVKAHRAVAGTITRAEFVRIFLDACFDAWGMKRLDDAQYLDVAKAAAIDTLASTPAVGTA